MPKHISPLKLLQAALLGILPWSTPLLAADPVVTIQDFPGTVGPIQVVIANKLCEKNGLQCRIVTMGSTPLAVQSLIGGSVDLASGSIDVMVQAASRGNPIRLVWGDKRINPFFVAVNKAYPLPHGGQSYAAVMQDLKGAKIGVTARGASTETQFVALLQGAGMAAGDVTFVAVGAQNTALDALRARQVDAIVTWEPAGLLCIQQGLCNIAIDLRKDEGPAFLTALTGAETAFAMRADYIENNPAVVAGLLHAFTEADAWLHDPANFEALLEIGKKQMEFANQPDPETLRHKLLHHNIGIYSIKMDRRAVQAAADYLYDTKQAPKKFDTSGIVWPQAPQP